jgi:hypothetical protein
MSERGEPTFSMPLTKWGCDLQTCVTNDESCSALRVETIIGLGFREEYKHEQSMCK